MLQTVNNAFVDLDDLYKCTCKASLNFAMPLNSKELLVNRW